MMKPYFRFATKIIIKILLFAISISAVMAAVNSGVFTNQMALGQMQQSNEMFALWEVFRNVKQYVYIICGIGWFFLLCSVSSDVYKFIKTMNSNEQENEE